MFAKSRSSVMRIRSSARPWQLAERGSGSPPNRSASTVSTWCPASLSRASTDGAGLASQVFIVSSQGVLPPSQLDRSDTAYESCPRYHKNLRSASGHAQRHFLGTGFGFEADFFVRLPHDDMRSKALFELRSGAGNVAVRYQTPLEPIGRQDGLEFGDPGSILVGNRRYQLRGLRAGFWDSSSANSFSALASLAAMAGDDFRAPAAIASVRFSTS